MELKALYPQSLRAVVRENFWWYVAGFLLAAALILTTSQVLVLDFVDQELLIIKKWILLVGVAVVLVGRTIYSLLFRATFQYGIHQGRLNIVRGILLKEEALLPLMPLTELYVRRSWLDMLFGLSNIYIAVILERAKQIGEIKGLKTKDAHGLRDAILVAIDQNQNAQAQPNKQARADAKILELPQPVLNRNLKLEVRELSDAGDSYAVNS